MAAFGYTNPVMSRGVPGYSPAADQGSWSAKIADIFGGLADNISDGRERKAQAALQYAQAGKTSLEAQGVNRVLEGRQLYGQELANAFAGGSDINESVQRLASIQSQYGLDPAEAMKSAGFAVSAMPDTDPRKSQAVEFLTNMFSLYSDKAMGVGDAVTGPTAAANFNKDQETKRYGYDQQLAGQKYTADANNSARVQVAETNAAARVAAADSKANAARAKAGASVKLSASELKRISAEAETAVQRVLNFSVPADTPGFNAWLEKNNTLLNSPEYLKTIDVAKQLMIQERMTAEGAAQRAAGLVLNAAKYNAGTGAWEGGGGDVSGQIADAFVSNTVGSSPSDDVPGAATPGGVEGINPPADMANPVRLPPRSYFEARRGRPDPQPYLLDNGQVVRWNGENLEAAN